MVILKNTVQQDMWYPPLERVEILLKPDEEPPTKPKIAPGSVAYKPDGSYLAMWDGDCWTEWGEDDG